VQVGEVVAWIDSGGGNGEGGQMKFMNALMLAAAVAGLFSSCVAGRVDRVEDRVDRREDRVDRRHYNGPADRVEDYYDKRENVNDKLRGRRAILY
jgi:hypothetical protein